MLQIKNIRKEYRTGDLVQKALDDVSLNFRDNEFVAILGPSGSGKTTLLNIVGGLDRYDSGDLIINGISTKQYKDRDWDSYRNHTIGFVFQSYNLIPHQTILANVELALTIAGISKAERRQRAIDALTKVGLGDQIHKKPAQMSGGQMQRVAIARALVNDPDILLADEPTGALDSETSIQVMDLIKEIAADRLVVMVTHNPDLAEQYATRIVTLQDGRITSDSDPFIVEEGETVHKNLGRASMSLLTALSLSINNMRTKLARTLLVSFAGSIGIIGIALILSLSNGVNAYIHGIEEDTLQQYPLQILQSSIDLGALMGESGSNPQEEGEPEAAASDQPQDEDAPIYERPTDDKIREYRMMDALFTTSARNDMKHLKEFLESGDSDIDKYASSIEYLYGVEPLIYQVEKKEKTGAKADRVRQVHPDTTGKKMSSTKGGTEDFMDIQYWTAVSVNSYNIFHRLPQSDAVYKEQYDVKAGRWPEKWDEVVLVLDSWGMISDLCVYDLGFRDSKELEKQIKAYADGKDTDGDWEKHRVVLDYDDVIGLTFKAVNRADTYTYNSDRKVWVSKSENNKYMKDLVMKEGEDLTIVGIVRPKEGVKMPMLQQDLYYHPDLVHHMADEAADSAIVKEQLANEKKNVLTGKAFGEDSDDDVSGLFEIDEEALAQAFKFNPDALGDPSKLSFDPDSIDVSKLMAGIDTGGATPSFTEEDIQKLIRSSIKTIPEEDAQQAIQQLLTGFMAYAAQNGIDLSSLTNGFQVYLSSDDAKSRVADAYSQIMQENGDDVITDDDLRAAAEALLKGYGKWLIDNDLLEQASDEATVQQYLASDEAASILAQEKADLSAKIRNMTITDEQASLVTDSLMEGYAAYMEESGAAGTDAILDAFSKYLATDEAQAIISKVAGQMIDEDAAAKAMSEMMAGYMAGMEKQTEALVEALLQQIVGQMQQSLSNIDFSNLLSVDGEALANALGGGMSEDDLIEFFTAMMTTGADSYEGNLADFGYVDFDEPIEIDIYAKDFEAKGEIDDILKGYNKDMEKKGLEDRKVVYTDIVAVLMGSVTDIIDAISYVLIAFVSISLLVSSIMIGVITYISVLERRKEIGILRAIGASKRNISHVFNAETLVIGGLAGLMGIGVSLLLLIPINAIIDYLTTANVVAFLQPKAAILLILLSVILTLIGGLIPSRKAAKSDPVTALRTE